MERSIIRDMRLWYAGPEERGRSIMPASANPRCRIIIAGMGLFLFLFLDGILPSPASSADHSASIPTQRAGKAASPHVGSAMAVLATLEQARVLPPEGTADADRVIQSVIQIQSLFLKSRDPAVRDFLQHAVASKTKDHAPQVLEQFQSSGWTGEMLEALADAALAAPPDTLRSLAAGLGSVNLSVEDFRQFMQLVKDGEQALASEGRTFREIFAAQRAMMPGTAH